jgi:hypothetical protein
MYDRKIELGKKPLSRQNHQTEYRTERDPYNPMYDNDQRFSLFRYYHQPEYIESSHVLVTGTALLSWHHGTIHKLYSVSYGPGIWRRLHGRCKSVCINLGKSKLRVVLIN